MKNNMINELEHCDSIQYDPFDILTRKSVSSCAETFYYIHRVVIQKYYDIKKQQQILKNMKKLEKQT